MAISDQVLNGVTELCHLTTVPVYPATVSNPLVFPAQMVEPPVTVPPTETGSTVTVAADDTAEEQVPLCSTARN